jgi:hypothetical protein
MVDDLVEGLGCINPLSQCHSQLRGGSFLFQDVGEQFPELVDVVYESVLLGDFSAGGAKTLSERFVVCKRVDAFRPKALNRISDNRQNIAAFFVIHQFIGAASIADNDWQPTAHRLQHDVGTGVKVGRME